MRKTVWIILTAATALAYGVDVAAFAATTGAGGEK